MSLIRFENVAKGYAGVPVLDAVSLRVEAGEKVGLIGRNGTGKSTIFRLITGETEPDRGSIERMRRLRLAILKQLHDTDPETSIHAIALGRFAHLIEQEARLRELEDMMSAGSEEALHEYSELHDAFTLHGGYDFRLRVKQVLSGLGFSEEEFTLPFRALSGGQRTRVMLALVLLEEADLMLLDEPENHLDLEAREWLEDYLKNCRAAVFVISHDRRTLNAVCDRILELERGEVRSFTGNYDQYLAAKTLLREQQQAAYERQQEFIRREEAWIDRFRYKATKARAVQSRVKQLEKLELVEAPPPEADTAAFRLGEVVRTGAVVLDADNLSMSYGKLRLYEKVKFQVHRGERLGIIGPNGAGKTTLLRHLAGKLEGGRGTVALGHKVTLSMYEQNHESLNPAATILAEVHSARPEWKPEQVRTFLGKLLFRGDDVFKTISTLSGGELSRVAMAKLILGGANLILLDEPTNHLDLVSREALEAALKEFPGAIVMVSHDRMLIDRLVDRLIILDRGHAEVFLGNYSDYLWKNRQANDTVPKATEAVLKVRREPAKPADKPKPAQVPDRKQKRRLAELEDTIASMEALIASYADKFAAVGPTEYEKARVLQGEYEGLKADLQGLYEEWETLSAKLDNTRD